MRYSPFILFVGALFVVGCTQPQMQEGPPQKPAVPEEMAKLDVFLGTWAGTAEMISPSPEELKKAMGPGAEEISTSFKGQERNEKVLGGMFIRTEGWHDMGKDQRASYVSYMTWDPKAKKYRWWYFGDWDGVGEGWMKPSADGKTWKTEYSGMDPSGAKSTGRGTTTFITDGKLEWTWSETGAHGRIELKGTSTRQ